MTPAVLMWWLVSLQLRKAVAGVVGGSDRLQTTGVYRAGYGMHTTPGIAVLISY